MRKFLFTFGIAVSVLLFSCQKEKSIENGSGSNNVDLLARTVIKIGSDSIASLNSFDANKRLVSKQDVSSVPGLEYQIETQLDRDPKGVIQQMTVSTDDFTSAPDVAVYTVHYDAAKSRYTSRVTTFTSSGLTIKDSTAITYDAAGKVIKTEKFLDAGISGGAAEYAKTEFAYDGSGNVTKTTLYDYDNTSGSYVSVAENSYEYDDKINPLNLKQEAFLLEDFTLASSHNVTKQTYKDFTDPSNNDVISYNYIYNSNNRPQSATVTAQSAGSPFPVLYVYQ
jgi:hypothetical protein